MRQAVPIEYSRTSSAVVAITFLISSGCDQLTNSSNQAAAAERERLVAMEVQASECVANLAKLNPLRDAEHDFAASDKTPIGMTNVPHDPPEPQTYYEKACEHSFAGEYRKTGKWFTYTVDGFSFSPGQQVTGN